MGEVCAFLASQKLKFHSNPAGRYGRYQEREGRKGETQICGTFL